MATTATTATTPTTTAEQRQPAPFCTHLSTNHNLAHLGPQLSREHTSSIQATDEQSPTITSRQQQHVHAVLADPILINRNRTRKSTQAEAAITPPQKAPRHEKHGEHLTTETSSPLGAQERRFATPTQFYNSHKANNKHEQKRQAQSKQTILRGASRQQRATFLNTN
mmetsp:Transcript_12728/g.35133  ORF Transcript_12728/g.35133 Transcript_12728/m.35133 type:complete len:167 (-) Transcript_12728:59-559(-)